MKKKPQAALLAALVFFLISAGVTYLAGCATEDAAPEAVDLREEIAVNDGEAGEVDDAEISRDKLIKKGELHLQADDVTAVSREVEKVTGEFKGFVEESSFAESNGEKLARYTLRVPAEDFDAFIAAVAELAQVTKSRTFTEDVSEQFIDLEARLTVLQAQEGRLMELMKEAEALEDILELERELSRVREPIEKIQGRLEHLERQVSYSTLSLMIEAARGTGEYPEDVWGGFLFNLQEGWRIFIVAFTSTVGALLYLWPFVLIAVALGFWLWKRKARKA